MVTAFRFMCNFCLVAFALTRIGLIGKKHIPLVEFMSKILPKNYLIVTTIFSLSLSWIKLFKYQLNFGQEEFSFPKSNEYDIFTINLKKSPFLDFYFVFNSIVDIINYVVFVGIIFAIDIYMIVRLRKVLENKMCISKLLNIHIPESSQTDTNKINKMPDYQDTLDKSSNMVILNTIIGVCFKLPLAILPVLNTYAQFYYKNSDARFLKPRFDRFYSALFETGFYFLAQDVADLLYLISLSIQFFVFNRFDKKFKSASLKSTITVPVKVSQKLSDLTQETVLERRDCRFIDEGMRVKKTVITCNKLAIK